MGFDLIIGPLYSVNIFFGKMLENVGKSAVFPGGYGQIEVHRVKHKM